MKIRMKYKPHPKQKAVHESHAKYRAVLTGLGFGKTALMVNEMIKWGIENPSRYAILAPTHSRLKDTVMFEFFKFCPKAIIKEHKIGDKVVTLITGASFHFMSADDERDIERLRGPSWGGAGIDEINSFPYLAWEVLVGRIRDGTGTLKILVVGTPKGMNWTYTLFVLKKDPKGMGEIKGVDQFEIFGGSTMDNPFTPESYKRSLENIYTGRFREQELFGKFVAAEGLVYPMFSRETHVTENIPEKFKYVISGIDFGSTNPSAIAVIGFDGRDNAWLVEEYYQRQVSMKDFADAVKKLKEKWTIEMFYADPSAAIWIRELADAGMPIIKADNDVKAGIAQVTSFLDKSGDRPRLMVHKSCINAMLEFEQYRYLDPSKDSVQRDVPQKAYDHLMDALRYAIISTRRETIGVAFDKSGLLW